MTGIKKDLIKGTIEELSGLAFKGGEKYSEKAKIFFEDRYSKVLSLVPSIKKNDVGLEIGLAGGVLAFLLKRAFFLNNLYTLEHPITCKSYSIKYLEKLKQNNIFLKPVDLRLYKLPWADNYFDFIIFSEVVEHLIPSDIPGIIKEIERVLKVNGWLLITTPNIASLLKRINLLFGKNPIEFDLLLHEKATYGHIREYTMNELKEIILNQGFDIEKKGYFVIDGRRNVFTQIESACAKLFPPFGNNLAIIARKK